MDKSSEKIYLVAMFQTQKRYVKKCYYILLEYVKKLICNLYISYLFLWNLYKTTDNTVFYNYLDILPESHIKMRYTHELFSTSCDNTTVEAVTITPYNCSGWVLEHVCNLPMVQ